MPYKRQPKKKGRKEEYLVPLAGLGLGLAGAGGALALWKMLQQQELDDGKNPKPLGGNGGGDINIPAVQQELKKQNAELQSRLQAATMQIGQQNQDFQAAGQQLIALRATEQALEEQLTQAKQYKSAMDSLMQTLINAIGTGDNLNALAIVNQQLGESAGSVRQLVDTIARLKGSYLQALTEQKQRDTVFTELQQRAEALRQEFQQQTAENETLKAQLTERTRQYEQANQQRIAEAKEYQQRNNMTKEQLTAELNRRLTAAQQENQNVIQQINETRLQLTKAQAELKETQKGMQEMNQRANETKAAFEGERKELQAEIKEMTKQRKNDEKSFTQMTAEMDKLKETIQEITVNYRRLESENKALKDNLQNQMQTQTAVSQNFVLEQSRVLALQTKLTQVIAENTELQARTLQAESDAGRLLRAAQRKSLLTRTSGSLSEEPAADLVIGRPSSRSSAKKRKTGRAPTPAQVAQLLQQFEETKRSSSQAERSGSRSYEEAPPSSEPFDLSFSKDAPLSAYGTPASGESKSQSRNLSYLETLTGKLQQQQERLQKQSLNATLEALGERLGVRMDDENE